MIARSICLACVGVTCFAAAAFGQARPVTLAWDAALDASVAGYVVYVGRTPGSYEEQHDVGRQTSFVYAGAVPGRPYYFSVASYAPGFAVGPPSEEVMFLSGVATVAAPASLPAASGAHTGARSTAAAPASPDVAYSGPAGCAVGPVCDRAERIAIVSGSATALVPTGDGRLFFIEDGARVRVIERDGLVSQPALSADVARRFAGLVLDPEFSHSRFIYVGVVDARTDGGRELSVVRYRELANVFGEGAAIVTGLPLPPVGDAYFAIDSERRVYVAVPAATAGDAGASRYGGMVLRFERDGGAVRDDPAAPVFALGYAQPTAMAWSASGNELWLSGEDAAVGGMLGRIPLDRGPARFAAAVVDVAVDPAIVSLSPLEPVAGVRGAIGGRTALALVDRSGQVLRIEVGPDGLATTARIGITEFAGRIVSAVRSAGSSDTLHLVVDAGGGASPTSHIFLVRLPAS